MAPQRMRRDAAGGRPGSADDEAPTSRLGASGAPGGGTAERAPEILIVEDHADTAKTISQLLRLRGYRTITAGSLVEARELLGERRFGLLVSDLGLPDGSGIDLMKEVSATRRRIPAIALSGYGMEEDVKESLAAGFAIHLTKPVEFSSLLEAIDRLLPRPASSRGEVRP